MECGGDTDSGSSSGSGCAGCGCGGGGSTPFLQLIAKNGEVVTLNDIMVTSPSSMYRDPLDGAAALKSGDIGFDVYAVAVKDFQKENKVDFILKEIEYETSSIAELSYATAVISEGSEIASDDSHEKTLLIANDRYVSNVISPTQNINHKNVFTNNVDKFDVSNPQPTKNSLALNPGEELSFTVKQNANGPTHLAVAAFFHHLYTGGAEEHIPELQGAHPTAIKSTYQKSFLRRNAPFVGSLGVLLAILMPTSVALNDQSLIKISNTLPFAHADTPHSDCSKSLYYYYKNTKGAWVHFSTMHPRFKLSHRVVAQVPEEAFAGDRNEVEIKVVSNAKHFIYSMGLVDQVQTLELSNYTPVSGVMNNATEHSFVGGTQLTTQPGDSFKFTVPVTDSQATHIFFKIQGHYSPLVCAKATEAKEWWSRLTAQEQAMMNTPFGYGV